ncbi:hypothetical protein [Actinopolymorpha rutila]|uniref:DUF4913 domain-containing protein n=1 Tax=Actinopolymorpha rutila TaxID=446787 RepID=A0A852Z8Q1_9ACTN|nr:hypothetical protein [Actinopolymorpha rutila]NYH88232.1 hypothetical protein [Actinopolymorpha rutila]
MTEPDKDSAALAGLAREVEALRRSLGDLDSLPKRVAELAELVAQLGETTAARTRKPPAEGTPSWLALPAIGDTDSTGEVAVAGEAAALLEDLVVWLDQIYLRYTDAAAGLPECWLWHPDVIEELLWLRHTWRAAYEDPDAGSNLAGDWHDRQRPGVVRRIKAAAGACSLESHLPGGEHHHPATTAPLTEALALISKWWETHREETPPQPAEHHIDAVAGRRTARRRP